MRKAAGIMLIIVGMYLLVVDIITLTRIGSYLFPFTLLPIVFVALLVTGGVLCIRRRYWGLCLASALVAIFIMTRGLITASRFLSWEWFIYVLGILPVIFVCITRKEWKGIQG